MSKLNRLLYHWITRQTDPRPLGITRIGIGIAFVLDWFIDILPSRMGEGFPKRNNKVGSSFSQRP